MDANNTMTISRRQMLQLSGMGFGTMALAALQQQEQAAGAGEMVSLQPRKPHFEGPAKAVIQLVMTGGPSQMDLFDPKPVLNQRDGQVYEIKIDPIQGGSDPNKLLGTPFKFSQHGESGMDFSSVFPHLPTLADDLCMIRSFESVHNNHTEGIVNLACGKMFVGRPTMGAWISYGLGSENQNLPGFVVLRDPDGYSTSGGLMSKNGWMPALYGGTEFSSRGSAVTNLQRRVALPNGVQARSLQFLAQLNAEQQRRFPENSELETRIRNYELAARMQLSATQTLDISDETEASRKLYGLDNEKTQNYGLRCLMARRLIESGVRFVQVFSAAGQPWDHHNGLKNNLLDMSARTDLPTTGLIKDLKQRGLLDSTIVMWGGEFGRMPVAQNSDGRDHNKRAGSFILAGGGFKKGLTYGATDEVGYTVVENRFTAPDMFACVMHQMGLDHREVKFEHAGRLEDATDSVVTDAKLHPDIIATPVHLS